MLLRCVAGSALATCLAVSCTIIDKIGTQLCLDGASTSGIPLLYCCILEGLIEPSLALLSFDNAATSMQGLLATAEGTTTVAKHCIYLLLCSDSYKTRPT